jgi:hypothetical protein
LTEMTGGRPRQPNNPRVLSSLENALNTVARPNPFVLAWRWRYELGLLAGLGFGSFAIVQALGAAWLIATWLVLVAMFGVWPRGRRLLIKRAWCVITPHRLRTGCAHAWIQSRGGRLPIVLLTTPRPFGERVTLWCVAGISATDLIAARDVLIAACWAADIRIIRSQQHAHMVIVDVIRRPSDRPPDPEAERMTGQV